MNLFCFLYVMCDFGTYHNGKIKDLLSLFSLLLTINSSNLLSFVVEK